MVDNDWFCRGNVMNRVYFEINLNKKDTYFLYKIYGLGRGKVFFNQCVMKWLVSRCHIGFFLCVGGQPPYFKIRNEMVISNA